MRKNRYKSEVNIPAIPNGTYFSMIRLQMDQHPSVPCERILQIVCTEAGCKTYVTESAYIATEAFELFNRLVRHGYENGIKKQKAFLVPGKDRIHWREFGEELLGGNPGPKMDPQTGEQA